MWNHDSRFLFRWIFVYIFCLINILSAIFFPSPLPLGFVGFSPLMFVSVTGAFFFPLVWGLMAGLRCCASYGGIISI